MKLKLLGSITLLSVFVFSLHASAVDRDYNDGLRDQLNQSSDDQDTGLFHHHHRANDVAALDSQTVTTPVVQPANGVVPVASQPAAQTTETTVKSVQPIYIIQQPIPASQPQAPVAQVQPTTTIDATAVNKDNKADQLRRQREDVEHQTESKLIEKLEDDRLSSEKARAEKLFSNATPTPAPQPTATPAPVAVVPVAPVAPVAPVVVPADVQAQTPTAAAMQSQQVASPVQPVAAVEVNNTTNDYVPVDSASLSAKAERDHELDEVDKARFILGPMLGVGEYSNANFISGTFSAGVSGEIVFPSRLGVEVDALFSSFNINNIYGGCYSCSSIGETLNQTDISAGVKYGLIPGNVVPVVGVLLDYARRSYTSQMSYYNYNNLSSSSAFNAGLMAGVDVYLSKHFIIGAEFRYLWNISYSTDNPVAYYYSPYESPRIETLGYYFATLNLKYTF